MQTLMVPVLGTSSATALCGRRIWTEGQPPTKTLVQVTILHRAFFLSACHLLGHAVQQSISNPGLYTSQPRNQPHCWLSMKASRALPRYCLHILLQI